MYVQQVQQKYNRVQHSTARTHRFDVWCMPYSRYSRYSRYSNTVGIRGVAKKGAEPAGPGHAARA